MRIDLKSNRPTIMSVALLMGLPLLFLWRVAFAGQVLISLDLLLSYEPWRSEIPGAIAVPLWNELAADTVRNYYPVALYITELWRNGQLPTWYPYIGNSIPLLGNGFFQALYPVNVILWLIMPVHKAFGWSAILHLGLGSLGTYLFVRELGAGNFGRLVSAIAFTYCGSLVIWLGVPSVVDSMIWLPFMFFGFEAAITRRDWRWTIVGAIGGALQILGGHIQLALYGFTGFTFYVLCRAGLNWLNARKITQAGAPLIYAALILAAGVGLAAFQLAPTLELLPRIIRSDIEFELYTPPINLLRAIIPDVLGTHTDGEIVEGFRQEAYLYFGLLPLFFVAASLFSPQKRIAGSLFGVGALFLLVIYNVPPIFQLFRRFYPSFESLGFQRTLFVITFLWASAAGIGADWLLKVRPQQTLKWLIGGGLGIGAVALFYVVRLSFIAKYQARYFWNLPDIPEINPNLSYHLATFFFFFLFLAAIIVLFWWWAGQKIQKPTFVGIALLILISDLFLAHIDTVPALPETMLYPVTPSLKFLQERLNSETEPYRISSTGRVLWPSTGGVFMIPSAAAYSSFPLKRYDDYVNATGIRATTNFRVVTFNPQSSRLLDALNVKYIYTTRSKLNEQGDWLSLIKDIGNPQISSEQPAAGEVATWTINNWTQPVLQAPAASAISFLGPLPKIVTLETAIAIHPDHWQQDGVLFEIYTGTQSEPRQHLAFSQILTPNSNPDHRDWIPVTLTLQGNPDQPALVSFITQPQGPQATLAGWADPLIRPGDDFELLYYGPNNIYYNKNYLPRAWVAHQVTEVDPDNTGLVIDRLKSPHFDPAIEAVIEGSLPIPLRNPNPEDSVSIETYNASEVVIKTHLTEPGLLVFSDAYYPGWQVYVDEITQTIYPTNLIMRGVFVDRGQHTVKFAYHPLSFKIGVGITVGTLLIISVALGGNSVIYRRRGMEL